MDRDFVRILLNLFFKLHYVAAIYSFIIVPLALLGGYFGLFVTYPFIPPALFLPLGPISASLVGIYLLYVPHAYLLPSRRYGLPPAIVAILVFKALLYACLGKTKIRRVPTILLLAAATIATCTISTHVWKSFIAFSIAMLATVGMDLTVFSYVKYRDVLAGTASKAWMSVLSILWSFLIWLPVILAPRLWLDWMKDVVLHPIPLPIFVGVWIAITMVQIWFSMKHYHMTTAEKTSE